MQAPRKSAVATVREYGELQVVDPLVELAEALERAEKAEAMLVAARIRIMQLEAEAGGRCRV